MSLLRRGLGAPVAAGNLRIKVAGLAVIAAVPIAVLAGVVVDATFAGASETGRRTAAMMAATSAERYRAALDVVHNQLAGIARVLPADPTACTAALETELVRDPGRWGALSVQDADGAQRCRAGTVGEPRALERTGTGRAASIYVVDRVEPGERAVASITRDDGSLLTGVLPAGWFQVSLADPALTSTATWLLDQQQDIVALSGSARQSIPQIRTLRRLLGGVNPALVARSAAGVPFAYAATRLANGWLLIQAYQVKREYARASREVAWRLAALAALFLTGVAAIVTGVTITFGEPLQRLSAAVTRWNAGGPFEPGALAGAPWEVRELARAFGGATTALRQREADLVQARERQDLLVLEIHHRVKNNLQIVASLLNLQASRIRVPEARAEFQAARDRVRALATLHRHLYSDGELHTINMRSFLVELCGQLFQAMGETAGERIVLSIEAPELRMSSDQAVPLALIVTEAVTNSVKYAFPAGRSGHVSVRLTEREGDLDLVIEDDGVGIPDGSAMTEAGRRDGLGRQLIRGFARQLGASLDVAEGQGTRYGVRLRLKPPGPPAAAEPLDAA